jgi:uncharacterized membrane protein HdeD (DUF308 family)
MAFWITFFRSLFAITLGLALILQPNQTRPVLANFVGMYWLGSGVLSLRWSTSQRSRWGVFAAVVGILAGLSVLGRTVASNWLADDVVLSLLGFIVLLTGIIHAFEGFQSRHTHSRRRSWPSTLLGLFEIVLGLILVVAPLSQGPIVYLSLVGWAFMGGAVLMGDAFSLRQQARSQPTVPNRKVDDKESTESSEA